MFENLRPMLSQASSNSKVPRATSLEQRDPFPAILSPILRSTLTGYQNSNYPVIKQEQFDGTVMKQEYYGNEQMPHSTVGSLVDHRRLGLESLGRNKPKPPKPRPVRYVRYSVPAHSIRLVLIRTLT